jgi:hypothetical protein
VFFHKGPKDSDSHEQSAQHSRATATKVLKMAHDATMPMWKPRKTPLWKPLEPLGPYYGKSWFIPRRGEGAFSPLINYRKPEEAAKARRMPMPPNLETYAAAMTRDKIDDETVVEWSPFRIP